MNYLDKIDSVFLKRAAKIRTFSKPANLFLIFYPFFITFASLWLV